MAFDFIKNETVKDLGSVPSEYQSHYIEGEADGEKVFVISEASKALVSDYNGVNTALSKSNADKKRASDESAKRRGVIKGFDPVYDGLGLSDDDRSAEGVMTHMNGLLDQIKGGKEVKINLDKINSENAKRMKELGDSKDAEYQKLRGSLVKHMVTEAATACIAKERGSVALLLPIIAGQCKVVQEGDSHVVRVVDSQGDARSNGAGGMLDVAGLVREMKTSDEYARAFDSEQKSGGGKEPGSSNKARSIQRKGQGDERSPVDKIQDGINKRRNRG